MSYVFFSFNNKKTIEGWKDELSLLFLTNKASIKEIKQTTSTLYEDESKLTIDELVWVIAVNEISRRDVVCFKFPSEFETDKQLISSYKSSYVGYVAGKQNKANLVSFLSAQKEIQTYNTVVRSCFSGREQFQIQKGGKMQGWKASPDRVSESEYKRLLKLHKQCIQPVMDEIDKALDTMKQKLSTYPKLVQRQF